MVDDLNLNACSWHKQAHIFSGESHSSSSAPEDKNSAIHHSDRMKLIGFVSDENYLALANVAVELESLTSGERHLLLSSARGALYGDIPSGSYRVTLSKDGYGAKWVICRLEPGTPYQFRLLSDCILGFVWPKWVDSPTRLRRFAATVRNLINSLSGDMVSRRNLFACSGGTTSMAHGLPCKSPLTVTSPRRE